MKASLWIEITIAGAVYLVGASFWILAFSGAPLSDLRALAHELEGCLPYLSIAFAATAYIVGVLAHRTVQLVPGLLLRRLATLIQIEHSKYEPGRRATVVRIWQYGSERLHRELDFQFSLVALLRSLLVSLPFSGAGLAVLCYAFGRSGAIISIIGTLLIWSVCLVAFRRQWGNYINTEQAAAEALEQVERKALGAELSSGSELNRQQS